MLDKWELQTGDNLVFAIDRALEDAQAGLVVFSAAAKSIWVKAEISYLIWLAIEEASRSSR